MIYIISIPSFINALLLVIEIIGVGFFIPPPARKRYKIPRISYSSYLLILSAYFISLFYQLILSTYLISLSYLLILSAYLIFLSPYLLIFLSSHLLIFLSYQLISYHSVTAAKIVFPLKNSGSGATNPSTTK